MSHDDDDEVIIILSITLPDGCGVPLDNLVNAGSYGSSREDVARHFICRALGVDPRPQLPEPPPVTAGDDAADVGEVPVGGEDSAGLAARPEGAQSEK